MNGSGDPPYRSSGDPMPQCPIHSIKARVRCELDSGHTGEHMANLTYFWSGADE